MRGSLIQIPGGGRLLQAGRTQLHSRASCQKPAALLPGGKAQGLVYFLLSLPFPKFSTLGMLFLGHPQHLPFFHPVRTGQGGRSPPGSGLRPTQEGPSQRWGLIVPPPPSHVGAKSLRGPVPLASFALCPLWGGQARIPLPTSPSHRRVQTPHTHSSRPP